ncbi:hypothetical protein ACP70R_004468 [Stipagrostis hirtigluma subsp. patula]
MKNSWLLSLLLAVATPLAAAWSRVSCGEGSYGGANTYESNFRRLAAILPAELASAPHSRYLFRAVGYWPHRSQAVWECWGSDGECAACIADAFEQVEDECPYRREAWYNGDDCNLRLSEFSILDVIFGMDALTKTLISGMIFQAIGLALLFYVFLRAWLRDSNKGIIMRYNSLPSGDQ